LSIKKNKVMVIGAGYVGLSISVMLAQRNDLTIVDIDQEKINLINNRKSPIKDDAISDLLLNEELSIKGIIPGNENFESFDFVILATPTDFNEATKTFDTSVLEEIIGKILKTNFKGLIIIKSTIPIGFTDRISKKYDTDKISFSPEFLREGSALEDNQNPSRIIVGGSNKNKNQEFMEMIKDSISSEHSPPFFFMKAAEAEAVKLFSNAFLAMRVSFFNELDSFSMENKLNTYEIIQGVSCDPRIGNHYNNPSFGYGGYCLPKDTKQLLSNFGDVPQNIFSSIIASNQTRKELMVNSILEREISRIGVYRLNMKQNSDNFRESAILDILDMLKDRVASIVIYEPLINESTFKEYSIIKDLEIFKEKADLIISNRFNNDLEDVKWKVFTRDIFNKD